MSVLSVIIYALVVLIAVMLIALILVQPSKSGGFGSAKAHETLISQN